MGCPSLMRVAGSPTATVQPTMDPSYLADQEDRGPQSFDDELKMVRPGESSVSWSLQNLWSRVGFPAS